MEQHLYETGLKLLVKSYINYELDFTVNGSEDLRTKMQLETLRQYFELRLVTIQNDEKYRENRKKAVKFMFHESTDIFGCSCNLTDLKVNEIMKLKSSLVFVCDDFPNLSETLQFSKFMLQLDDVIASWPVQEPPLVDYDELLNAHRISKEFNNNNPDHSWWNFVDSVVFIKGMTLREAAEKLFADLQEDRKRRGWPPFLRRPPGLDQIINSQR